VLVRTAASLISAGTERMTVELGRKSLIGKARERPDLVRQVIQKAQREGLMNTLTAVQTKLNAANALGYSAAGVVIGAGDDAGDFRAGDRVACAGAGFASHAEVLSVPKICACACPTASISSRPPSARSAQSRCKACGSPNPRSASRSSSSASAFWVNSPSNF
jgi:hypothetical protein